MLIYRCTAFGMLIANIFSGNGLKDPLFLSLYLLFHSGVRGAANLVRRLKKKMHVNEEYLKCQYLLGWFPLEDISPTLRR